MIRLNQQKSDTMKNKIYENVLMLSHCGGSKAVWTMLKKTALFTNVGLPNVEDDDNEDNK